jgi:hypothetical protein
MINIDYSDSEIKVSTENINNLYSQDQLPLNLEFVQQATRKIIWSTELNNYGWASFPNTEMIDVVIRDKNKNLILHYPWSVLNNGTYHYKVFYLYCKNITSGGKKATGIAIGTHNGEFGEWVPLALENKIQSVLVEASEKQFEELYRNFQIKDSITMLNILITPDGSDVEFFEGGRGYTNTVVERVIRNWETEEVTSSIKHSISINDLIKSYYPDGMDWLHLDVEGLDAKLIMAIEEPLLPNLIVFEDYNLSDIEKNEIYGFLTKRKYTNNSQGGICTSIRN